MEVWVLGHRLRRIENPPWTLKDGLVWKKQTYDYRHLLLARTRKGKSDVCNSTGFVLISFGNLTFLKKRYGVSFVISPHFTICQVCEGMRCWLKATMSNTRLLRKTGNHALLTIPGSLVIRGCLDTKVDVLALQETWENFLWDKTFLEMSIWAQTSVQRLLALLVCCWTQTDGWFSPQLLPTNSSDSIRYIFRGPMQKPYDGIAIPTCSFR